ncbi:MAG: hypothetical protein AB2688_03670 [Candidatus Thiodiazotropha taylori]
MENVWYEKDEKLFFNYGFVANHDEPCRLLWKARFSVTPVTPEERQTDTFKECQSGCEWVELSEESANWAASNAEDV